VVADVILHKNMIKKYEIERERNRWVLRVILTFLVVALIMIGAEKVINLYGLPEKTMIVLFFIMGAIYLYQIYSYRKIKCPICGISFFNQFSILLSVPKECKNCNTKID